MRQTYTFAIAIARFASEAGITVPQACELHRLAARAFSAGERECNTGKSADGARRKVEQFAESLGLAVLWPGLWPEFRNREARLFMLPGGN